MLTTSQIEAAYQTVFGTAYLPSQEDKQYWATVASSSADLPEKIAGYVIRNLSTSPKSNTEEYELAGTWSGIINLAKNYLYYASITEVITPMADWGKPILEKIVFSTDVMRSRYGEEQRMRLRHFPRVELEYAFLVMQKEFQHFQNFINAVQGRKIGIPDWSKLRVLHTPLDTVWDLTEIGLTPGKYVLYHDYFRFEEVELAVSGNNLWFTHAISDSSEQVRWVIPVVQGSIRDRISLEMVIKDIAYGRLSADIEPMAVKKNVNPLIKLGNHYVYTEKLDWIDLTSSGTTRTSRVLDYNTGITLAYDLYGYSDSTRTIQVLGKTSKYGIRDLFIDCSGKFQTFYAPSFSEDLTLIDNYSYSSVAKTLKVRDVGYSKHYASRNSIKYLYIEFKHREGIICRTGQPESYNGIEYIPLLDPIDFSWGVNDVKCISYLLKYRFESDVLEVSWITPDYYRITTALTQLR